MAYYKTCPYCGASLDPGERCDCQSFEALDAETCKKIVKLLTELTDGKEIA